MEGYKDSISVLTAEGRWENANPLLSGAGALVTKDMKNAFFASVLNGKTGLQEPQAPETQGKV